jgi:hypothetical protein
MIVKYRGDQEDRENQAGCDPPSELEPYRVKGYFLAEPLSLDIAAEEIIRKDGKCRHKKKLKHGPPLPRLRERPLA